MQKIRMAKVEISQNRWVEFFAYSERSIPEMPSAFRNRLNSTTDQNIYICIYLLWNTLIWRLCRPGQPTLNFPVPSMLWTSWVSVVIRFRENPPSTTHVTPWANLCDWKCTCSYLCGQTYSDKMYISNSSRLTRGLWKTSHMSEYTCPKHPSLQLCLL